MTTSLKKAPEVTLWGFRFVYRLDTISFLATANISYAVTKIKYSLLPPLIYICSLTSTTSTKAFFLPLVAVPVPLLSLPVVSAPVLSLHEAVALGLGASGSRQAFH